MFFALSLGVNWNNHYLPWRLSQIQPMVGPTRIIIGLTNINYRWRDLISKSMYSGKFSFFISFVLLKIRIESCIWVQCHLKVVVMFSFSTCKNMGKQTYSFFSLDMFLLVNYVSLCLAYITIMVSNSTTIHTGKLDHWLLLIDVLTFASGNHNALTLVSLWAPVVMVSYVHLRRFVCNLVFLLACITRWASFISIF